MEQRFLLYTRIRVGIRIRIEIRATPDFTAHCFFTLPVSSIHTGKPAIFSIMRRACLDEDKRSTSNAYVMKLFLYLKRRKPF